MEKLYYYKDLIPVHFSADDFSSHSIKTATIINMINHIHFKDSSIYLYCQDSLSDTNFLIEATPEPCAGKSFGCTIQGTLPLSSLPIKPIGIILNDGTAIIMVLVKLEYTKNGFARFQLLDSTFLFKQRSYCRHVCTDVFAEITQNGIHASGNVLNFSPQGFCISLPQEALSLNELDLKLPVSVTAQKYNTIIFNGICSIIGIRNTNGSSSIILEKDPFKYENPKREIFRSPRQKLIPTPKVVFLHPFTGKQIRYEIYDISTTGFSVLEKTSTGFLIPGIIIPCISIIYNGGLKLRCSAEIIHKKTFSDEFTLYGFSFLDMDTMTYNQLFSSLCNAYDQHINTLVDLDTDALWDFFFSSGFVYEKKYHRINQSRDKLKKIYKKLYSRDQRIFTSITYEKNGMIFGHVSMIKAYPGVWMVHHLAALPMDGNFIGMKLLRQIIYYFRGCFQILSSDMNFVLFYYRPENKFPELFFTGACRSVNDRKVCSIDLFDYLSCTVSQDTPVLPENWSINSFSDGDLLSLQSFYDNVSGGLLLDALPLNQFSCNREDLYQEYKQHDLKREYSVYSLKKDSCLAAVFIVDQSDIGVNLSELLNCFKVILTNNADLTWDIIHSSLSILGKVYNQEHIPVLMYPSNHACMEMIVREKQYRLLIVNKRDGSMFLEQLRRIGRIK